MPPEMMTPQRHAARADIRPSLTKNDRDAVAAPRRAFDGSGRA
jgi:hypothetical protein